MSGEPSYLIRKGGAYYRPNCAGYTNSWHEAGRYTLSQAVKYTHPNGPDGPRDGMDYIEQYDATDCPHDQIKLAQLCEMLIEPSDATRSHWDMVTAAYVAGLEQIRDQALPVVAKK